MLEAVKFPARVADLDAGLPDVDRDALPHLRVGGGGLDEIWGCEVGAGGGRRIEPAFVKTPDV
jgi:hypothetical protein